MIKEYKFDYKNGKAIAKIEQIEKGFSFRWWFEFDGRQYGDISVWPENPGDDKIIEITKIRINDTLGKIQKNPG
ncbi:MAG TPA: hypothetical protein DIT25_03915 [Candidatus Moranbacteria bacterium]|nr:hypothetical protein [Candidatus Moranbacteria bacterium]